MPANEALGEITPIEWKAVLETARDFDLQRGGYWDGRGGCVNAWCGPDDKPRGWPAELEITRGALAYPRSYLAMVWMEWPKDHDLSWTERQVICPVLAEVGSYDVRDWRLTNLPAIDRLRARRSERLGRVTGDLDWLRAKWQQLLEAARARVPRPLELHLGDADGHCWKCAGPVHIILEVLSSPWDDHGVGDWTHYCAACRMLTVPVEQIRRQMQDAASHSLEASSQHVLGHVIGVGGR